MQILRAGQAIGRFDSRPWSGEIDVPTSVVVTVNDRLVAPERQMALAADIPAARLHESGGGHNVVLAEPRRFVPPLLDAVRSVSARGAAGSAGDGLDQQLAPEHRLQQSPTLVG
jgi:3-oxoadipate enol-lactonase